MIDPTRDARTSPPNPTSPIESWSAPRTDLHAVPHSAVQHRTLTPFQQVSIDLCCDHFEPHFGFYSRSMQHTLAEVADSAGLPPATVELLVSLGLVPVERVNGEWMITGTTLVDAGLFGGRGAQLQPRLRLLLNAATRLSLRNVARVHGSAARWRHTQYLGL